MIWGCFLAHGTGKHLPERRNVPKAFFLDFTGTQWCQTHSIGSSQMVSIKENEAAKTTQLVTEVKQLKMNIDTVRSECTEEPAGSKDGLNGRKSRKSLLDLRWASLPK